MLSKIELTNMTEQDKKSSTVDSLVNLSTPLSSKFLESLMKTTKSTCSGTSKVEVLLERQHIELNKLDDEIEDIELQILLHKKKKAEEKKQKLQQQYSERIAESLKNDNASVNEIKQSHENVKSWIQSHFDGEIRDTANQQTNIFQPDINQSTRLPTHNFIQPNFNSTPDMDRSFFPTPIQQHIEQPISENVTKDDLLLAALKTLQFRQARDLPTFNGDNILEWPNFIGEFNRSTDEFNIKPNENLRRLNKALSGQARRCVQTLLSSPDNVNEIIEALKINFGRSDWIVMSIISKLRSFPPLKDENIENFKRLFNEVYGVITAVKNLGELRYLESPDLLSCVEEKLPPNTRNYWIHQKADYIRNKKIITVESFGEFLKYELDAQYAGVTMKEITKKSHTFDSNTKKAHVFTVNTNNFKNNGQKQIYCTFCKIKTDHNITKCKEFQKKSVDDRRNFVKEAHLCFSCLRRGHGVSNCQQKDMYKCNKCGKHHHSLLHIDENPNTSEQVFENFNCFTTNDVLLRIGKVNLRGPNGVISTYAFFDDGSTATMIDEDIALQLGLSGPKRSITYRWTNEIIRVDEDSTIVNLEISPSAPNAKYHELMDVRTVKNLSLPHQRLNVDKIMSLHPQIDKKLLNQVKDVKPTILIGSNYSGLTVPLRTIQYTIKGLQKCKSHLGWTIHGPIYEKSKMQNFSLSVHMCTEDDAPDLTKLIEDSYKIDVYGITDEQKMSEEDQKALNIMESTIKNIGNRYEIGQLYKFPNISFPTKESKIMATKRLQYIENKMDKDSAFAKAYIEKINEYVEKDYAVKLEGIDAEDTSKTFYLPHFGVYNPNKPGKFRLVMDAKAKAGPYSLNDLLLKGPDLVPPLLSVIWRGRLRKIAISADIKEMFHQVLIRPLDRNSQRFLFRGMNRDNAPEIYQMKAMIFGAVSSPSIAQYVKNFNAINLEEQIPGIVDAITKQHYVDDYFDSLNTPNEAIDQANNVMKAHKMGGFELVKWISNSKDFMNAIAVDLRLPDHDKTETVRILGLLWNTINDEFVFSLKFEKSDNALISGQIVPTKRQILKFMMSIFDPIGFLGPFTIKLKILFQELWRKKLKWDSQIPEDVLILWKNWIEEAKILDTVTIPRCYFPFITSYENVQLHMLSDAGDKAFCAVVYLRIEIDGIAHTNLVQAKARVAPLKELTIPRLELQAAVIGSQMCRTIAQELNIEIEKLFFYTDSTIVLSWINTQEKLGPYVGSRITKILDNSNSQDWRWIPTHLNTADLATKIQEKVDLSSNSKWFKGPSFLSLPEGDWPIFEVPQLMQEERVMFGDEVEAEEFVYISTNQVEHVLPDINRFSKYWRLVRTTAYVIKMIKCLKMKKKDRPDTLSIDIEDINEAKILWYKKVQTDCYSEEIKQLKRNGFVKKSSKIYTLSPEIDENDLIRMKSRIPNKKLVILSPEHKFTQLMVNQYHISNLHQGTDAVINQLREIFWIPKCRSVVKRVSHSCKICKIMKAKPKYAIMADIPKERSEKCDYPFTFTGLDYFGPIEVKHGRKIEKVWGALFTCLTTRGIHVEIVNSLTSNSAIMAIQRFINLRGVCKKIFCDNGTSFVGASNELKEFVKTLESTNIKNDLTIRNIKFVFNPPAAPHMGGVWERMV